MTENREQDALNAYLKLLRNKQVAEPNIQRREIFLLKLEPLLYELPSDGYLYREAVENLLEHIDKSDWRFCLAVAREYFHFWMQDMKAIAALNKESGFHVEPLEWQPVDSDLKSLWETLDQEKFGVAETWPLKAYTLALRQEGAAQAMIDTRLKLVKLLLVRLKDAPHKDHKIYRIAVDSTVPLFSNKKTRRLFFAVVREFYYFWIGDPDAAEHILHNSDGSFV